MKSGREYSGIASIDWSDIHRKLAQTDAAIQSLEAPDAATQERILRERATALAREEEPPTPAEEIVEVLEFQSAGERYALEAAWVAQVLPYSPPTWLPGAPDFVVGIIAMHGEVLSVVDPRSLLDLPISDLAEPTAIIVLRNDMMEFGLLAEQILGVARYPRAAVAPPLPTLANTEKTYLSGIGPGRTAILNAQQLLSDRRLVVD